MEDWDVVIDHFPEVRAAMTCKSPLSTNWGFGQKKMQVELINLKVWAVKNDTHKMWMEKDLDVEFWAYWEILQKFLPTVLALGDYSTWHKKLASLMALWYFGINGVTKCTTAIQRQL